MSEPKPLIADEQLVAKLVDHGEWMIASGQCRMTVIKYLECLRYRDDDLRQAVLAEAKRRQEQRA